MVDGRARRRFLLHAAALAAAAHFQPPSLAAASRPKWSADPFALGVASGWPRPEAVVLWTRLAPTPMDGGGMGPEPVEVRWEIAEDEGFRRIARSGKAMAEAANAHAVHVDATGLAPSRWYFYRFIAAGEASPVGRTRTAPAPGEAEGLRLAYASCQHFEHGHFGAHAHLAAEAPDVVAFLGDYIYESSGRNPFRAHLGPEPRTLEGYRNRYAQYKREPQLQRAHAAAPWICTWDDHEVENDYADDRSQTLDPEFLARRVAAYRAYFEHMPLPPGVRPAGGGIRLYDRLPWGAMAMIHVLDGRQYRSHQACPKPGRGGSNTVTAACAARLDPSLTVLGAAQERWLEEGFAASRARWNVVAQQTLMAGSAYDWTEGRQWWTDGWDGYPAARERFLAALAKHKPSNPVVISGDVHANFVADLRAAAPGSPTLGAEFCGTALTSRGGLDGKRLQAIRDANPQVHFAEGVARGYGILDIGPQRLQAGLRVVADAKDPDTTIATLAAFTVEHGRPGIAR